MSRRNDDPNRGGPELTAWKLTASKFAAAMPGGLFAGLIDDAAVFPPGSASLPDAVDSHRRLRQSPACTSIGPLLLPAAAVSALLELIEDPAEPLIISLVGAPGNTADLIAAVDRASRREGLTVAGVEIAVAGRTISEVVAELEPVLQNGLDVAIEIDRGHPEQFAELARLRLQQPTPRLRGKFRTGGLHAGAVPSAEELASVIVTAVQQRLPIKLTAGLHHAVRTPDQHGVLNVLLAVQAAFSGPDDEVADRLLEDDPDAIATSILQWTPEERTRARTIFTSFGCCGVLEPLSEAARLGLITPVAHDLIAPPECR